ncbi:hypothetical protein SAMN02927921_02153 [Sinomicrobium oceani]|uniref:Immunity protein 43 n=1 Tax=Sinomicrobium oceani TaxID=1150368 RepID=A0A1K1PZ68_9FLAO|nr:hypothetical protein [Sinomicrobium oceani]SFW52757.1 hypothetical protein SAMN02927921_02153 [Sinomicrobium oceani]
MRYYYIGLSNDLKVIGYYPQTDFHKGYNPTDNGSYCVKPDTFPDFVPNYELELHKKAFATGFLQRVGASFGIVVDEKVKNILKEHCLPPHAFYPTTVFHNDEVLQYYWFHYIPNDFWELIDNRNSFAYVYQIKKATVTKIKEIPIISKEQILNEKKKYTGLTPITLGRLKMSAEFCKYDFYLTGAFNHTMISERLKKALEENNVSGYEAKLFDKLSFE